MKRLVPAWTALAVLAGCATTPSTTSIDPAKIPRTETFGHALVQDQPLYDYAVVRTNRTAVLDAHANAPWRLNRFRPNPNLPEMVNAELLAKNPNLDTDRLNALVKANEAVLFTIPRLKVLPCDEGCVGNKDYEKAVKDFTDRYDAARGQGVAYRGEMTVKVRWFNKRSYLESINPLSLAQDVFAIQFPIEGNLLTISSSSFGRNSKIEDRVALVSTRFRVAVVLPLSYGLRNGFSVTLDPAYDPSVMERTTAFVAPGLRGIKKVLGQEDYSSRIEPLGADNALLPAVDGLKSGEVVALDTPVLFN